MEICQSLASSQLVEPRNIGVIAAFRRQVLKIRVALRAVSLGAVNVGSVEDFQVYCHYIAVRCTNSRWYFKGTRSYCCNNFHGYNESHQAIRK